MKRNRTHEPPLDQVRHARELARQGRFEVALGLWEEYFSRLAYMIARRWLTRPEDQEDAVAEARSRFRKIGDLRHVSKIVSWVRTLVTTSCADILREREGRRRIRRGVQDSSDISSEQATAPRYRSLDLLPADSPVFEDGTTPDRVLEGNVLSDLGRRLRDIVWGLPTDDRLLVASALPKDIATDFLETPESRPPDEDDVPTLSGLAGGDKRAYERLKKRRSKLLRLVRQRLRFSLVATGEMELLGHLHDHIETPEQADAP